MFQKALTRSISNTTSSTHTHNVYESCINATSISHLLRRNQKSSVRVRGKTEYVPEGG